MQHSSSSNMEKISPLTAMKNKYSPRKYLGWYAIEECRHHWRHANNSKHKTLHTHRKGK